MRNIFLLLMVLCITDALAQDAVFKSVDSEGGVIYADEPPRQEMKTQIVELEDGPSVTEQSAAKNEADAMIKRSDEQVQRRLDRNMELAKQRQELQAEKNKKVEEVDTGRSESVPTYYPVYTYPIIPPPRPKPVKPMPPHTVPPVRPVPYNGISAN